jgi:hypothetical protein
MRGTGVATWIELDSPLWPLLVGLAALVVAIVHYQRDRLRKRLTFRVSDRSLLRVRSEVAGEVRITYLGEPVRRVHLVTVMFANAGNAPIPASDFEAPITISLPESGKLLTAEVADAQPSGLAPEVTRSTTDDDPRIVVAPVLLNPGDSFTVTALVADFGRTVRVGTRIVGIPELLEDTPEARQRRMDRRAGMLFGLLLVPMLAVFGPFWVHLIEGGRAEVLGFELDIATPNDYRTARLSSGREVCVRSIGSAGSQQILRLEDGRLLAIDASDVDLSDNGC